MEVVFSTDKSPIVSRVTISSAQISLTTDITSSAVNLRAKYGTTPDNFSISGSSEYSSADDIHYDRLIVSLNELMAGTLYYYHLQYAFLEDSNTWYDFQVDGITETYEFITARKPGQSFSTICWSDTHIGEAFDPSTYTTSVAPKYWLRKRLTDFIENTNYGIINHFPIPDFYMSLGDEHEIPTTYIQTQNDAYIYGKYMRDFYATLLKKRAFYLSIGNHENRSYWAKFTAGYYHERWRTIADKKFLLNPINGNEDETEDADAWMNGGDPTSEDFWGADDSGRIDGNVHPLEHYYNFRWGDAEFFVIDPFPYIYNGYLIPANITLGDKQLNWLINGLTNSTATWKIVISHVILGGLTYSRGGIGAVQINNTYMVDTGHGYGLHDKMNELGVNIYLKGHDHFMHYGLLDNVYYMQIGTPSWRLSDFTLNPDHDLKDSYINPTTGQSLYNAWKFGCVRFDVSPEKLTVCFIQTNDIGDVENNPNANNPCYVELNSLELKLFNDDVPVFSNLSSSSTKISLITHNTNPHRTKIRVRYSTKSDFSDELISEESSFSTIGNIETLSIILDHLIPVQTYYYKIEYQLNDIYEWVYHVVNDTVITYSFVTQGNFQENYSFELHEYDPALHNGVLETKSPSSDIITINDFHDGIHFRTGPEDHSLILKLENRLLNLILDESGSMTWNDANGDRFTYFKRLLTKLEATYPGQIKVNLIGFGGSLTKTTIFVVAASSSVYNSADEFDKLTSKAFGGSIYDLDSVRVVRNSHHFPVSEADGVVIDQGIIESAKDTDLTAGHTYYYGVWTFNSEGVRSRPFYISGFPYDRILPEGVHYAEIESRILPGVKRDEYTQIVYNFAEKAGYIIFDSSENGRHGFTGDNTIEESFWAGDSGSRTYVTDRPKNSTGVKFDGQLDLIETDIDNSVAYIPNTQALTINLWMFRYQKPDEEWILGTSTEPPSNTIGWAIGLQPDGELNLQFNNLGGGFTYACGVIIPEKYWTMVTVILDTNIQIYINGILRNVFLNPSADTSGMNKLYIGAKPVDNSCIWPGLDYFGCINYVSVANIARSGVYISELYLQENKTYESTDLTTNYNVLDNYQREVVIKWVIGQNYSFENGKIRIVRKYNQTPSHANDGDIILEKSVSTGESIYLDTFNFVHGSNYIYRIFTFNSLNLACDIKDARILPVNIPRAYNASQLSAPPKVSNIVITSGNKKIMLEWNDPDVSTYKGTKIFYSLEDYPAVDWNDLGQDTSTGYLVVDTTDGWYVHRKLGMTSDGNIVPLPNEVTIYYIIVTYDKYGIFSDPVYVTASSSEQFADRIFPPTEIANLYLDIINPKTLSIQWANPALKSETIDLYFNDAALIFVNIKDIYGGQLEDITNMELEFYTTFNIRNIIASKSELGFDLFEEEEIYNNEFSGEFPSGQMSPDAVLETNLQYGIVSSGLIKGSITNTKDKNVLSRREYYTMLVRSKYIVTDPETNEETFRFFTSSARVKFHNPLRIAMINQNNYQITEPVSTNLPRGMFRCSCKKPADQEPQTFDGAFINASNPYIVRAEIQFKGEALPDGYPIRVAAYKSFPPGSTDFLNTEPTYVNVQTGVYNTRAIKTEEEDNDGNLTGREINKSILDIPVPAPTMPESVDIYVKADYLGFLVEGVHTVTFLGSVYIKVDATQPMADGIDITEQFATAWFMNPDNPDEKINVPDGTLVKWSLLKGRYTNKDRPFYSTESISEFLSGVYSTVTNGMARHVFMGPVGSIEEHNISVKCKKDEPSEPCCLGDEYIVQAEIVVGELSAKDQFVFSYTCPTNDILFSNKRLLINADPNWQDLVIANDPEWITWADGIHMIRCQIAQNPVGSEVLGASCFVNCIKSLDQGQSENQIFQLPVGHIVQITAPGEILWDVSFDEDPYTGKITIVSIGGFMSEKLATDMKVPNTANIPIRGSVTDFYIRKNAVINQDPAEMKVDSSSSVSLTNFLDGKMPNEWSGRCKTVGGCKAKGTKWSSISEIKAQSTVFINGKEVILVGGGGYEDGIPPVLIGFKEPLIVKIIEARKTGQSGPNARVKLERDENGQQYLPVEKIADGISHITFVVVAIFAGESIQTVEPVYIDIQQNDQKKIIFLSDCVNAGQDCEVSSSGIVFMHLVHDPFINPDDHNNPGSVPKKSIAYFTIEPLPASTQLGNKAGTSGTINVRMDYDKRGDIDQLQSQGVG